MTIDDTRSQLNGLLAERSHAARRVDEESRALRAVQGRIKAIEEAQAVAQAVAETVQNQAVARIASVVGRCLDAVFGEGFYGFRIDFVRARGKTEARLILMRDGNDIDEPLEACGGGVVDVCSFALRLAALMLSRPRLRRVFIADEPFRFINGSTYQERVGELIEILADDMDMQFVFVGDDEWLRIGKVVQL